MNDLGSGNPPGWNRDRSPEVIHPCLYRRDPHAYMDTDTLDENRLILVCSCRAAREDPTDQQSHLQQTTQTRSMPTPKLAHVFQPKRVLISTIECVLQYQRTRY